MAGWSKVPGATADPTFLEPRVSQLESDLASGAANVSAVLQHGQNVISPSKGSIMNPVLGGRTLVNLIGRDGNFEKDTVTDGIADGWTVGVVGQGGYLLDTVNFKYGSKGQRISALSADSSVNRQIRKDIKSILSAGKYYIALADVITDGVNLASLQLYNDAGGSTESNAVATNKTHYVKINLATVGATCLLQVNNRTAAGSAGWVSFDGVRLYEIDQATYNKIEVDAEYTGDKLADKFPYVDSIKHVQNPMITKQGKNLLPPFTEWGLHANAVVTEPYKFTLTATANFQYTTVKVPVLSSQTYSITANEVTNGVRQIVERDVSGALVTTRNISSGLNTLTFTTFANTATVDIQLGNGAVSSGTFNYTNPQLELGSAATAFEPQNIDYLYGVSDSAGNPLKLASNLDGSAKDSLFYRDGSWRKEKRWVTDVVLDGALPWTLSTDFAGYKAVYTTNITHPLSQNTLAALSKHNGIIIPKDSVSTAAAMTAADKLVLGSASTVVSVADSDTGWGETYVPTTADVQNYFNGWKLQDNAFGLYSSGTKYYTALELLKENFEGKVLGSVVENANILKYAYNPALVTPASSTETGNTTAYADVSKYDNGATLYAPNTVINGNIAQAVFSYNLIEHVLRKYGAGIFGAAVTTVDRVAWLKANIGKVAANWFGYGSGPAGNKATLRGWDNVSVAWNASQTTSVVTSSPTKASLVYVQNPGGFANDLSRIIDANGFVHFTAYADAAAPAANPTAAPTLSLAANAGSTVAAVTHYVTYSWVTPNGETLVSPEASIAVTTGNNLVVTIPALPFGVTSANIYISTTAAAETKQGSTTATTYTQSTAIAAGTAIPATNTAIVSSVINTDFVELEVYLLTQTIPAGYAYKSYTPYKLSYQLATTVEEMVTAEGSIALHTGGNQIEVSEGVIVREKVTPLLVSGSYYLNISNALSSRFKNRTSRIVSIYKTGQQDKKWVIGKYAAQTDIDPTGGAYASIPQADYDTTAEYTATYTIYANDKPTYAANVIDITGEYNASVRTVQENMLKRVADVETTGRVNVNALAAIYARLKAGGI